MEYSMKRFSRAVLVSLFYTLFSVSCATTVEVYTYQYDSTLDEVFVKENVDFSRYTAIIVDQVSVWYPDEFAPSPENADKVQANLARAQDLFRQTIADTLSDRYTVTDTPGKNVLRLHVEFIDLRAVPEGSSPPSELARLEFKTQPGHITMTGQLLDSVSGEQLARVADLGKQQSVGGNGRVDWNAIASDFEYWANIFSAWLDNVHDD